MYLFTMKLFWIIFFVNSILLDGKFTSGKAESDITLLSRVTKDGKMNITCAAGPNINGSALTFSTRLGGYYENLFKQVSIYTSNEGVVYPSDAYDCDFESRCKDGWVKWNEQVSYAAAWGFHDLAPVTDERWENFPTYFSNQKNTKSHDFQNVIRSVGLSVRTKDEAWVSFCSSNTWYNHCYWIILSDKTYRGMTLWYCTNKDVTDPREDSYYCKKLSSGRGINISEISWTHFNLMLSEKNITINEENHDLITLPHDNLSHVSQVKQISLGNTEKAIWKVHDYNYLSLLNKASIDPNSWRPVGPALQADDTGFVCVVFYAATCPTCTLHFRFDHSSEIKKTGGKSSQSRQHWELIRLEMRTTPRKEYRLQVQASGTGGYWLIDNVRRCHEHETRTISITVPMSEKDIISCQSLKQPDMSSSIIGGQVNNKNLDVCNNDTYTGSACGVSCLSALGTDCSNVIVCEPSASRRTLRCSCASGYTGAQCQDMSPVFDNLNMTWVNDKARVTWNQSPTFSASNVGISFIISIKLINTTLDSNLYFHKNYTIPKQDDSHYAFELPDDVPLSSTYRLQVQARTARGVLTYSTASLEVSSPAVTPRFIGEVTCGSRTNTTQDIIIPPAHPDTLTIRSFFHIFICNLTSTSDFIPEGTLHSKLHSWSECTGTSWIAANFTATKTSMNFTVGDFRNKIKNKPLTPDAYKINVIFWNEFNGDEKYVVSATATETLGFTEPGSNPTLYALLLLLLIPVVVVFVYYWKVKKTTDVAVAYHAVSAESSNTNRIALLNISNSGNKNIIKFVKYAKESLENSVLVEKFKSLPRGPTKSWDYGMEQKNAFKNRFENLTAYDHSRVVLPKINNDPYSDFINANYIDGYMQPKAYIATQDPKLNTVADFWRMVWVENVSLIVMVTHNENNNKFQQYWPEKGNEREFMNISIQLSKEDIYADFVIRTFKVKSDTTERQIQHLQYTSWPDNTVPLHPQLLVPFLREIRAIQRGKAPMIVHCSNGIGQTGTIILLDICLQLAKQGRKIKPLQYLRKMRKQRIDMVASIDQYLLVHVVLLEYLLAPDSSDNFSDFINKSVDLNRLMHEVAYLKEIECHNHILKENIDIIIPEIVSYNCYGEYVSILNPLSVDGFRTKEQYIFIPTPQIDVTKNFWALIVEYNVGVIVIFKDNTHNAIFWPAGVDQILVFTDIKLECIAKTDTMYYTKYTLKLQYKNNDEQRSIHLLHVTEMLTNSEPTPAQNLASLTDEVLLLAQKQKPAVLSGNEAAASLLATASHVLERMRELQQCDVLDSLRTVRASGLSCRPDKQQLQLLYSAAAEAVRMGIVDGYEPPDHLFGDSQTV